MSSGLAFAIPGRWTGGKREEDEMRRLMTQEAEAAKARGEILEETSASDWSSNEEENNKSDQISDDPGVSMALPAPPAGATTNPVPTDSKRHQDVLEILEDNVKTNGDEENKQVPDILPVQAKSGSSRRLRDDTGNDADMDDTSMSSRASSRMLESINVISMDSMNVM